MVDTSLDSSAIPHALNAGVLPVVAEAYAQLALREKSISSLGSLEFAEALVRRAFSRAADHLRASLGTHHGLQLKKGQALDVLSASLGYANWNVASAALNQLAVRGAAPAVQRDLRRAFPIEAAEGALPFLGRTLVVGGAKQEQTDAVLSALAQHDQQAVFAARPKLVVTSPVRQGDDAPWRGYANERQMLVASDFFLDANQQAQALVSGQVLIEGPALTTYQILQHPVAAPSYDAFEEYVVRWMSERAEQQPILIVDHPNFSLLTPLFKSLSRFSPATCVVWNCEQMTHFNSTWNVHFQRLVALTYDDRLDSLEDLAHLFRCSRPFDFADEAQDLAQGQAIVWDRPMKAARRR